MSATTASSWSSSTTGYVGTGITTRGPSPIAAGRNDNHVELQARWRMLGTPTKQGYHPIYIADPDDHRECPDTPPTGTALELLESAGGFLISASELAGQVSDSGVGARSITKWL